MNWRLVSKGQMSARTALWNTRLLACLLAFQLAGAARIDPGWVAVGDGIAAIILIVFVVLPAHRSIRHLDATDRWLDQPRQPRSRPS